MQLVIRPITFRTAAGFVSKYHRHHGAPVGNKWSIGLFAENEMVGCAICGRPVSRYLGDGNTLEITRVCVVDGIRNGCSRLYGACCRIAREMGYKKVVTYTLESENGASLKASNFVCEGVAGNAQWTGKRYEGKRREPQEKKTRWTKQL